MPSKSQASRGSPQELATEEIRAALEDPQRTLDALDRVEAEESLMSFVELTFPIIEPGRKFFTGWAIQAIAEHLEAVTAGQIKRLIINVPPNFSKSAMLNVWWPAWMWGPRSLAEKRFLCLSYADKLTIRDNRTCLRLIQSNLYQRLWGDRFQIARDLKGKKRFGNDHRGEKIASSILGSVVGERGDIVALDDPNDTRKAESEVIRESVLSFATEILPTRTYGDDSAIVISQQRVHERDVSGLMIAKELGFEHLCLPMEYEANHPTKSITILGFEDPRREENELLWPERFDRSYVERLKKQLSAKGGDYAVAGQLQQRPAPREGGMFQRKDFRYEDKAPANVVRVRGWDLAGSTEMSSKYTCGVKMSLSSVGTIYVEDVLRFRGRPAEVEEQIKQCANADGQDVCISIPQDPGQAGLAQKMYFARGMHGSQLHFSPETGSKEDRARPFAAQAGAGNVVLVRGKWHDEFVAEACVFPNGAFTDQIDAASRAYARLMQLGDGDDMPIVGPRLIEGE